MSALPPTEVVQFASYLLADGHHDLSRLTDRHRASADSIRRRIAPMAHQPNFLETIELLLHAGRAGISVDQRHAELLEAGKYYRRYVQNITPHAAPWMTALEMQFAAMSVLRSNPDSDASRSILELQHLKSAIAYDWAVEPAIAVGMASRTIPDSTTLLDVTLEQHAGWWWFGVNESVPAVALLWARWRDGVLLSWYLLDDVGRPWSQFVWGWPFGDSLATMLADHVAHHPDEQILIGKLKNIETLSRFFLAGCTWLNQRIVTTSYGHIERHRRKQLAREHNAPLPSDVKVIQLRRAESQSHPSNRNGEAVDWSCRWIVGGHWRNQPYKDERKLIYIMPYVKGPADMPLKVPTHTVYQVSR